MLDRTFRKFFFRASQTVDRRILCSSETSIDRFSAFGTVYGSVRFHFVTFEAYSDFRVLSAFC